MARDLARRDLLRGRFTGAPNNIRPPHAAREKNFIALCRSAQPCNKCMKACPVEMIDRDDAGYPKMNFEQKACTFCHQCEAACPVGALASKTARPWTIKAHILPDCLSINGIVCRSCGDHCEPQAIRFKLMTRGRSAPLVNHNACTGCGACRTICPNKSIEMIDQTKPEETLET